MITGIAIENFKGIGDRVDVKLKPITLLFGANSAGKSSILHALQYATEVFERRNLNAGSIGDGAAGVDLGGFQHFVHGHKTSRDIILRFSSEFGFPASFPSFSARTPLNVDDPSTLFGMIRSAQIELAIGWSNLLNAPFVRRYAVALEGTELAEIQFEAGSPDCELSLNEQHPTFVKNGEHTALALWHPLDAEDLGEESVIGQLLSWASHTRAIRGGPGQAPYTARYGLLSQKDALPDFDRSLSFDGDWDWVERDPQFNTARISELSEYLTAAISQVVVGPGRLLRDQLSDSRFLGPIREVPERSHTASRQQGRDRWSSGLAAWDRLETADRTFVDEVSDWLGDSDRLNAGCQLERRQYKELDLSHPVFRQLASGRAYDEVDPGTPLDLTQFPTRERLVIVPTHSEIDLHPRDVGIGISQLVPVVVAALDRSAAVTVIEQPELHLHPAVQVGLGDLFIHAIQGSQRTLLIETHSEHLLLRLLRRVRETTDSDPTDGRSGLLAEQLGVVFVESQDGMVRVTPLSVTPDGNFAGYWPEGFFEERSKELF